MKILYYHRTTSKDGQAVHIEVIVGALRKLGHEVRVVGPTDSGGSMGDDATWVHKLKAALLKAAHEIMELAYTQLVSVPEKSLRCIDRMFENRDTWPAYHARGLEYLHAERTWQHTVGDYAPIYERVLRAT